MNFLTGWRKILYGLAVLGIGAWLRTIAPLTYKDVAFLLGCLIIVVSGNVVANWRTGQISTSTTQPDGTTTTKIQTGTEVKPNV